MQGGRIFSLDLNVTELFGNQDSVYDSVVYAIILGIRNKDVFPPVPVAFVDEIAYLTTVPAQRADGTKLEYLVGGHHRAKGHHIEGVPLLCEEKAPELAIANPHLIVPIPEVQIVRGSFLNGYGRRSKDHPNYKPVHSYEKVSEFFRQLHARP